MDRKYKYEVKYPDDWIYLGGLGASIGSFDVKAPVESNNPSDRIESRIFLPSFFRQNILKYFNMAKKLIVFDVDGVLLDNKLGGFKDILVLLGGKKEVQKIDKKYQKKKFTGPWGLRKLAKLYQGISKKRLEKLAIKYCKGNLMKGAKECLEKLKMKGFIPGALSSNPQFIMDALSEILPLNFSEGTKLEFKNGIATGKIQRKVDRYIKAKILKEKIKKYKLKKGNAIVVGDSITDLPMAKEAKIFIAFLPKEKKVGKLANFVVKKKNLKQILKFLGG